MHGRRCGLKPYCACAVLEDAGDVRRLELLNLEAGTSLERWSAVPRRPSVAANAAGCTEGCLPDRAGDLSHLDAECVLKKPITLDQLVQSVRECLTKHP